jgi:hypothetical protein
MVLFNERWFRDARDIFSEAISRFLDSRPSDLMQKYGHEDVEWGLHGDE